MRSLRRANFPAPLAALITVALLIFWIYFAPLSLGGQAAYVVVNGNSMEPLYHRGDLVILQRVDEVQVGEVYAYQYPDLGTVIHRLIDRDGERFIFKGDHNSWNDGYHPETKDLVGKAWIHIPGIGNTLIWLRQPIPLALLIGLLGGTLMFGFAFNSPGQPEKKKKTWRSLWKLLPTAPTGPLDQNAALFALTLLLFLGVALGIISFSRPLERTVEDDAFYAHLAKYQYTAPADPKVYDKPRIENGDPIFSQLTCKLNLSVDYAIASSQSLDVAGSYRMVAVVSEFNGWKRTIELAPTTAFADSAFHAKGTLDVCAVRGMVNEVATLTGMLRPTYNVSVITDIHLTGKIGGRDYTEDIAPALNLALDSAQLYVIRDDSSGADPFNWKKMGMVTGTRNEVNSLSILGIAFPVLFLRILAVLAILASGLGLARIGLPLLQVARQDELAGIRLKYAHMLIQMGNPASSHTKAITEKFVEVGSMSDLVRLAQNAGVLIMEKIVEDEHHFMVLAEPYSYRYIWRAAQANPSGAENGPSD